MLAKKVIFTLFVLLLASNLAFSAPPAKHPKTNEQLIVKCLKGTAKIDGNLNEWQLNFMQPAVLDTKEQIFLGQGFWDGPKDCSGSFYLMWDDKNIYIAVIVKDDKISMNKAGGDIWNADAIEIFFSTTNAVAGHAEHYQYGFNANNQKWNWCNMDGAGSKEPDYLQIASSKTADGYICEASVEYKQMKSLDFKVGNSIGFHPVIDDTEAVDREIQITWTGREAHDQSQGFGYMNLTNETAAVNSKGKATLTWGAIKSQ
ncbi:TPA: hypothetical protein ENX78_14060 [Candidatus Poribacteria bacterium]|nr:hypothetical protein [Candidatus Poribacteria bacterium]